MRRTRLVILMVVGLTLSMVGTATAKAPAQDEYSIRIVGSAHPSSSQWLGEPGAGISMVDIPVIVRCPKGELVTAPWAGLTDYFDDGHLADPHMFAHSPPTLMMTCTGRNQRGVIQAATIHNRQFESVVDPVIGPIGRDFEYFSHGKLTAKVQLGRVGNPVAEDVRTVQVVLPHGR